MCIVVAPDAVSHDVNGAGRKAVDGALLSNVCVALVALQQVSKLSTVFQVNHSSPAVEEDAVLYDGVGCAM
eukprot:3353608-Prymnesium_polylepis.1